MLKAFSSLRARALALLAFVFAVMLGMFGYHAVTERAGRIDNAKLHLLHNSEKIAAEQNRIV